MQYTLKWGGGNFIWADKIVSNLIHIIRWNVLILLRTLPYLAESNYDSWRNFPVFVSYCSYSKKFAVLLFLTARNCVMKGTRVLVWHPGPRFKRADRLPILTKCIFFSGSSSPYKQECARVRTKDPRKTRVDLWGRSKIPGMAELCYKWSIENHFCHF